MVSGAAIVELLGSPKGRPVSFLCADTNKFEKGDILWFGDAKLCSGASTAGVGRFAGIAATEKVSGDGSTHIGLFTCGIFDMYSGNLTIAAGDFVTLSGQNQISGQGVTANSYTIGKALESSTAGETIEVAVGIY